MRNPCPFLVAAALTLGPGDALAQDLFQSSFMAIPISTVPGPVAVGDVNADAIPDLVIPSGGIRVLLGTGGSAYHSHFTSSFAAQAVRIADMNGDGHLDLVAAKSDRIAILLGSSTGTFAAPTTYPPVLPVFLPLGLEVADVSGDGNLDVVVGSGATETTSRHVVIYQGTGNGTLGTRVHRPLPDGIFRGIVAADLNGDSDLDIAVGSSTGASVLLNDGAGGFPSVTTYALVGATAFAVAEFTGDGVPDILAGAGFFRGLGNGSFAPHAALGSEVELGGTTADVNADGLADVLLVRSTASGASGCWVYRGIGNGTFWAGIAMATPTGLRSLTAADLDGDGADDVVSTAGPSGYGESFVGIHRSRGDGSFGTARHFLAGNGPSDLLLADVTGDGRLDVVVVAAQETAGRLRVLPGMANGALAAVIELASPAGLAKVAAGDLNGDGIEDIVSVNTGSSSVSVFLSLGGGAFAPRTDYSSPSRSAVRIMDLDGDGRPDVVTSGGGSVSTYLVSPDGSLGPRTDYTHSTGIASGVANLDGNSHPDLVVLASGGYYYRSGEPAGVFGASTWRTGLPTGTLNGMYLANLAGGPEPDMVVTGVNQIWIKTADGVGGFGPPSLPVTLMVFSDLVFGDLDGDLDLDIALPSQAAGGVGAFQTVSLEGIYGANGPVSDVAIGDLDQDGVADLVTSNVGSGTVSVLLGTTETVSVHDPEVGETLAFSRVWPSPSRGTLQVEFMLPTSAAASIEVLDVAGRRVNHESLGPLGPGSHVRNLTLPASVPNGIYWLRLSHGSQSAVGRALVLR